MTIRTPLVIALTATFAFAGCGPEDKPYEAKEAYSGKKPEIPQPPTLPNKAKKEGDAYTVYGAVHDIHSVVYENDFKDKDVTLIGYIVQINWSQGCKGEMAPDDAEMCTPPITGCCVPKCAVFDAGKKDTPAGCEAPIPTFWIADTKDEKDIRSAAIPVMGWASNWSQIYSLIKELEKDDEATRLDPWSGVEMPTPIPNLGAKVKVTGRYGFNASVGSSGQSSNPRTGIVAWKSMEYLEKPEPTKLPFMD